MHLRTFLVTAFATIAILGAQATALASTSRSMQDDELRAFDGEWVYVEDRTEGRSLERLGPPMSASFSMRSEADAVILVRGHGSGHRDVRIVLDGSITEVAGESSVARYRGAWEGGAFIYDVDFLRGTNTEPSGLIHREFRITTDGLLVRASSGSTPRSESVGLYRHAEDIAMPEPAAAMIADMEWLRGAWVGTRGSQRQISIEERWSPPLGGAMLGVSRTVSGDSMRAFEYLRIVERDRGLVYVAQPNGGAATEFVLTEMSNANGSRRAVFDNPRHVYPKRIVYELSAEGGLTATVGFMKGGTPARYEFRREGSQ